MTHRRDAIEFRHHLRDHRAEMRLIALQLGKGVADMDRLDLVDLDRGILKRGARRRLDHVRDVAAFARPHPGEIRLMTTKDKDWLSHYDLLQAVCSRR